MDINTLRIAITLVTFAAFLFIVVRSYLPSRKELLDREGHRILGDDS